LLTFQVAEDFARPAATASSSLRFTAPRNCDKIWALCIMVYRHHTGPFHWCSAYP